MYLRDAATVSGALCGEGMTASRGCGALPSALAPCLKHAAQEDAFIPPNLLQLSLDETPHALACKVRLAPATLATHRQAVASSILIHAGGRRAQALPTCWTPCRRRC